MNWWAEGIEGGWERRRGMDREGLWNGFQGRGKDDGLVVYDGFVIVLVLTWWLREESSDGGGGSCGGGGGFIGFVRFFFF